MIVEDLGKKPRVLLAEDNPTNVAVVRSILDAVGLSAACVPNGHQAVVVASAVRFDLILMDVQMPVMDGLSAIRAIRRAERQSRCPASRIFTITTNSFAEDVAASLEAGADGHLTKPLRLAEFLDVLAPLL
jgi:CheY-like chemotaxis protein